MTAASAVWIQSAGCRRPSKRAVCDEAQKTKCEVLELAPDDELLNSLSQFDIAYCFVVATEGVGQSGYCPSSAAFDEDRTQRIGACLNGVRPI